MGYTQPAITTPMVSYLGTKQLEAACMNLGEYNAQRGWAIPENEDPATEGYIVQYPDGYISWSPKAQFEAAYRELDNLTFGLAIEALKMGMSVARAGWNGKGLSVSYIENDMMVEGQYLNPFFLLTGPDGKGNTWVASISDTLAEDWAIVV